MLFSRGAANLFFRVIVICEIANVNLGGSVLCSLWEPKIQGESECGGGRDTTRSNRVDRQASILCG